jgi:hypothetical protein
MRDMDAREIYALRWVDDPERLAAEVLDLGGPSYICTARDGEPVYAFGLTPHRPGVWTIWGFSTDRWPEVIKPVSRFIRKVIVPSILGPLAHRVECVTIAEKIAGHKWLKWIGAEHEATLRGYGRNREDYFLFTWRA